MIDDEHFEAEEPWEAEIGELLRGLPAVEPPDGFLASAIDRRPLHAGRTLVALTGLALGVLTLLALAGLTEKTVFTSDAADLLVRIQDGYERETPVVADDVVQTGSERDGAGTADLEELVEALQTERPSWFDRLGEAVDAVTAQLGFPATTS